MFNKIIFPWQKKEASKNFEEVTDQETGEITKNEVVGERTVPSVNKGLPLQKKITNVITIAGVICLGAFILYRYYSNYFEEKRQEQAAKAGDKTKQARVGVLPFDPNALLGDNSDLAPPPPLKTQAASPANADATGSTYQQNDGAPPKLSPEEEAKLRRLKSPVMISFDGATRPSNTGGEAPRIENGESTQGRRDQLADSLRPTYTPGVKAQLIPDRDLFITKGAYLDCILEPAIDTKVQGMISCVLSKDAMSTSGNVVLMEKGTRLTGEYSGDVKGSDARIFLLWSVAETPYGVTVALDSPGADPLGRAGIGGYVDHHFKDRYQSAFLVSLIEDGTARVINPRPNVNGNNNSFSMPNTSQSAQTLAVETFKRDSTIADTLTKNQGAHINVYVARNIDFRGVYKLEKR